MSAPAITIHHVSRHVASRVNQSLYFVARKLSKLESSAVELCCRGSVNKRKGRSKRITYPSTTVDLNFIRKGNSSRTPHLRISPPIFSMNIQSTPPNSPTTAPFRSLCGRCPYVFEYRGGQPLEMPSASAIENWHVFPGSIRAMVPPSIEERASLEEDCSRATAFVGPFKLRPAAFDESVDVPPEKIKKRCRTEAERRAELDSDRWAENVTPPRLIASPPSRRVDDEMNEDNNFPGQGHWKYWNSTLYELQTGFGDFLIPHG
ncbi:hypothetical protein B0H10DRAFT_2260880 [Mycena sp. CBHHK59/15]|nr:hypothetical protein B0H10DRAFT_2260880 [Mycena sp. CBHHK59/15]